MTSLNPISRVAPADWRPWRALRLQALQAHPDAFGSSFEAEADLTGDEWQRRLAENTALAFYAGGTIGGMAVYARGTMLKIQHRAYLLGMYVAPNCRRQGVGDALVAAVVEAARADVAKGVVQIHCSVVTSNAAACRLYQRHGFEIYGTEPRALKVSDLFHDEYLMVRRLD
jgi:ribosomal protein S18 acetylase RimI-like enzyme